MEERKPNFVRIHPVSCVLAPSNARTLNKRSKTNEVPNDIHSRTRKSKAQEDEPNRCKTSEGFRGINLESQTISKLHRLLSVKAIAV